MRCKTCSSKNVVLEKYDREGVRAFLRLYPWVRQKDVAMLLNLSQARISEIVRCDSKRGGN